MPGGIDPNNPKAVAGRWKKGQSGNPGGRKSTKTIQEAIAHLEKDAMVAWAEAIKAGESWAVTLWLHYWNGKPVDQVQLTGKDGEGVSVSVEIIRNVTGETKP